MIPTTPSGTRTRSHAEAVRPHVAFDDLADGIGQRRDRAQAVGHLRDALLGEPQPVDDSRRSAGLRGSGHVARVGAHELVATLVRADRQPAPAPRPWPTSRPSASDLAADFARRPSSGSDVVGIVPGYRRDSLALFGAEQLHEPPGLPRQLGLARRLGRSGRQQPGARARPRHGPPPSTARTWFRRPPGTGPRACRPRRPRPPCAPRASRTCGSRGRRRTGRRRGAPPRRPPAPHRGRRRASPRRGRPRCRRPRPRPAPQR